MRIARASAFVLLFTLSAALVAACSKDDAAPGGTGATTATGAGGAGGAGTGGAGGALAGFTYEPKGCGYTATLDGTRGAEFAPGDDKLGAAPAPLRVRLGLGGGTKLGAPGYADPARSAALVWDTDPGTTASAVRLGASADALDLAIAGFSYALPGTVPVRIHRADACGLTPKTTYYYQVGGGPAGKEVWSDVRSFTTAAAADPGADLVIGVSGDSRDSIDVVWPLVQTRMAKAGVDLQLFSGDSIKGLLPDGSEADYATWLDGAGKAGTLGTSWIAAVGGNHENLHAQWLGNHALPGSGAGQGLYASFDAGPAHVVLFDDSIVAVAEHLGFESTMRKEVLDWLDADLGAAAARRATVPWIIVLHHRGPLSTSSHADDSDVKTVRASVLPLYDKHHVDLVLSGHDHNYERSKPARAGADLGPVPVASEAEGTVYVVCAGAGADGYGKGTSPAAFRATNWDFDGKSHVGAYGVLTISGKTLSWKAMGLKSSAGGPEVDDVIDEASWSK